MEADCAVCEQLTALKQMHKLTDAKGDLKILVRDGMGITRQERTFVDEPIQEIKGPMLETTCTHICKSCDDRTNVWSR